MSEKSIKENTLEKKSSVVRKKTCEKKFPSSIKKQKKKHAWKKTIRKKR